MKQKNTPKKTENQEINDARQKEAATTQSTEMQSKNRALMAWETPEYIHHDKDKRWYIIAGSVVLFFVLFGIFTGSLSMAIAFLLLAGVYYIMQQQKPKQVHVIISEMGIHFGHRYYPYNLIESFWILYHPPQVTTLNIRLVKGVDRNISIELGEEVNPGDLRDYLLTQIPELEGKEESFTDALVRRLKL